MAASSGKARTMIHRFLSMSQSWRKFNCSNVILLIRINSRTKSDMCPLAYYSVVYNFLPF